MLVLLALVAAPAAQAAINQPTRIDHQVRFATAFEDGLYVISGSLDADLPDATGGSAYQNTEGLSVTGLAQVCWEEGRGLFAGRACETSPASDLSLRVVDGGAVGLKLPVDVEASVSAPHSLTIFSDISSAFSPLVRQQIGLSKAMVAALLEPTVVVHPQGGVIDGTMVTLDAGTVVEVYEGSRLVQRIQGDDELVTFDGIPRIGAFAAQTVYLPYRPGATAHFEPASDEAAAKGLERGRLSSLLGQLGDGSELDGVHDLLGDSLDDVLNGALFGYPMFVPPTGGDQFTLIRLDSLTASPHNGNLLLRGDAPLVVQGTEVGGSTELLGVAWFVLPWWSYALWVVAIGLTIARLAVRPPKPEPDGRRWIGWLAGVGVFAGMLILWDLEIRSLWGTSVGSMGASGSSDGGSGLPLLLLVQLYPLGYGLFAVAAPLRTILSNALRLGGQHRLTAWAGPIANVLAFIPATLLYRTYLGDVLARIGAELG